MCGIPWLGALSMPMKGRLTDENIIALLIFIGAPALAADDSALVLTEPGAVKTPPAEKGWGYAKWGMSPAEVIAAAAQATPDKPAAEAADSKGQRIFGKRRLVTTFGKFNYIPVSIDYYFEPKIQKLVFVRIQPLDRTSDCNEFEITATEKFGTSLPKDTTLGTSAEALRMRRREWDDTENGNIYNFSSASFGQRAPSHCQILIQDAAAHAEANK